ncbi:MAG TPA: DinB family protein [Bellilinea sp.]|nr:DinB family protein [Bellilinea sp.]
MDDTEALRTEFLMLLTNGPEKISGIVAPLRPEELKNQWKPGEWSVVEVLAHLRSCADVWEGCMRRIQAEDHPRIKAVNPKLYIRSVNYESLEFAESFAAFKAQRERLLAWLQSLPTEDWLRGATVYGAGKPLARTLLFYAGWLARHERTHYRQFTKIVRKLKG